MHFADLRFDNSSLHALPVEDVPDDARLVQPQRQVKGACWSPIKPEPLKSPVLVAASLPCLGLLDLQAAQVEDPSFVEHFSGNRLLPGSETAAHCYAGHQFGHFSGQLGDGAAIYLGEVLNSQNERWEVQLKGAGPTPYSRTADGRKVLRSSIREFLASEALYHLGIPTTRAGSVITSDSKVVRDMFYTGNAKQERCSVVLRVAPTFIRFGSFEIFKPTDSTTGRAGPSFTKDSALQAQMLPVMLNHVIKTYFPGLWEQHNGDSLQQASDPSQKHAMYLDFFREVVRRTAAMVAAWQCVGFCHGVLNTDNMSIIGVTLDYGPYGFLDRYDPGYVCNHSDDSGRYDYQSQPSICRWNCLKLAEAIQGALPLSKAKQELEIFDQEFDRCYWASMRRKLGLVEVDGGEEDQELMTDLLQVMHDTGADFTNTFRRLANFPMPTTHPQGEQDRQPTAAGPSGSGHESTAMEEQLLNNLAPSEVMAKAAKPRLPIEQLQFLQMLAGKDPAILAQFGASAQMIQAEIERMNASAKLQDVTPAQKAQNDRKAWQGWLARYGARLHREAEAGADPQKRVQTMNATNPRYILRNWIAQQAIEKAEKGDYSEVRRVLKLLQHPFSDDIAAQIAEESSNDEAACSRTLVYDGPVPAWAAGLCVSCSS